MLITPRQKSHWFSALTLAVAVTGCQAAPIAPTVPGVSASPSAMLSPAPTSPAPSTAAAASLAPSPAPSAGASAAPATVAPHTLIGTISTFDGPLADALVSVYPASMVGTITPLATVTAGADGAFRVTLDPRYVGVPLVVVATAGETSVVAAAMLPAPEASAARVLLQADNTVTIDPATTLVYLALRDRLKGLSGMKPTPTQIREAFKALNDALPAASASTKALRAAAKVALLKAAGPKGTGFLTSDIAREAATEGSELAKALEAAAEAFRTLIKARLDAGEKLPANFSGNGFSFGDAVDDRVVRRSSGGGNTASTPVDETGIYFVNATGMSVDREEGLAWFCGFGGVNGTLSLRSADNTELASHALPTDADLIDMEIVEEDNSVWVVVNTEATTHAYHINAEGEQMADYTLEAGAEELAVDQTTGNAWLIPDTAPGLYRLTPTPPLLLPGYRVLDFDPMSPQPIDGGYIREDQALAVSPNGFVWSTAFDGENGFIRRLDGEGSTQTDVEDFGPGNPSHTSLTFEDDGSFWLQRSGVDYPYYYSDAGVSNPMRSGATLSDVFTQAPTKIQPVPGSDTTWVLPGESSFAHRFGATHGTTALPITPNSLAVDSEDDSAWVTYFTPAPFLAHIGSDGVLIEADTQELEVHPAALGMGGDTLWVRINIDS